MTPHQRAEAILANPGRPPCHNPQWWVEEITTAIQAALNEELERSRAKLANVKQQLQDALRIAAGSLRDFNSMRAELAAERTRGKQALQAALEDLAKVTQERDELRNAYASHLDRAIQQQDTILANNEAAQKAIADLTRERDGLAAQYRRLIDLSIQAKVYSPPAPIPFDLAANNRQVAARVLREAIQYIRPYVSRAEGLTDLADDYEHREREVPA